MKSGTDFRQFSKITIDFQSTPVVNIEEVNVTKATPEDPSVKTLLEKYESEFFRWILFYWVAFGIFLHIIFENYMSW